MARQWCLLHAVGLAFVLAAPAGGCGGVHGIAIDKTANDIAKTVCPKAYSCCTSAELANNPDMAGASESECEAKTADAFRGQLQGIQASVDAKRAQYEQSRVDACLQTISASDCATLNKTNHLLGVPGCDSFVTPLVPPGGDCSYDYECIDGHCVAPQGSFDGKCVARVVAGMSCESTVDCEAGLLCDANDNTCVQPADDGAACGDGYHCKSGMCAAGVCAAATAPMCFYESGCSAAGGARPGTGTILLLVAFAVVALLRSSRLTRRR